MKGRLAVLVALTLPLAPAGALACPACATREGGGAAALTLIGLMIGVPYVIAVVVLRVVRALERES